MSEGSINIGNIIVNNSLEVIDGDGTINKRLFVGGDLSINGVLTANYKDKSIPTEAVITDTIVNNNDWFKTNFIDPPPQVVFDISNSTSTEINVIWKYPTQLSIGIFNSYIPMITSIYATISVKLTNDTQYTADVLVNKSNNDGNFLNNYVNIYGITGIVLSKVAGYNRIEQYTIAGIIRNVYVYHDTNLMNMVDSSDNKLVMWYANSSPSANKNTMSLPMFRPTGPPSMPRDIVVDFITATSCNIRYQPPVVYDIYNISQLTLKQFDISYSSLASNKRYGNPISDIAHANWDIHTSDTYYNAFALFPDCSYTFEIRAVNSDNVPGYVNSCIFSTSYLTPINYLTNAITFNERYYNHGIIKSVISNRIATRLVNKYNKWQSDAFNMPIHSISNRGSSDSTLMTLSTNLKEMSYSPVDNFGPIFIFDGFSDNPINVPYNIINNKLSVNVLEIKDSYTELGQDGFYLQSTNKISINTAAFIPSPYDYNLIVTKSDINSELNSSFVYQCDELITSIPIITNCNFNLYNINSDFVKYISGVKVLYGYARFSVITNVSNMGKYYYSSPLLEYTNSISGSWLNDNELDTTHISLGKTSDELYNDITITNNIVIANFDNIYTNSISLSIIANNVYAASDIYNANNIAAIVDGPSCNLVYSILAKTINDALVSLNLVIGHHITSGIAGNANVPMIESNANSIYNHTEELNYNQELQIANGKYTTYMNRTNIPFSYGNYKSYRYDSTTNTNTGDYSNLNNVNGYRYVTFAWRVSGNNIYNSLLFSIHDISGNIYIKNTDDLLYIGNNKLQLYYRIEDDYDNGIVNINGLSTAWINGNNMTTPYIGSGNYFLPADYNDNPYSGYKSARILDSQVNIIVSVPRPIPYINGHNFNIYCRVGIPINEAFSFRYISAKLGKDSYMQI